MCFNASVSICLAPIYLFANGQANELSISGSILSITVQWGLSCLLLLVGTRARVVCDWPAGGIASGTGPLDSSVKLLPIGTVFSSQY